MEATQLRSLAAQELLDRIEAKGSLAKLYERRYPQWQLGDFHATMASKLDLFIRGQIKRLIINVPPGHIKSMFASTLAPAAYMGLFPDGQFIGASYNTDLAKKFGGTVRDTVRHQDFTGVYEEVRLRQDSKAKGRWNTNQGGSYIAAAVEKPVTGERANRLCVDDPHADFTAGNDLRQTERDWEWFKSLYTRLMPGAGVAFVMQRMSSHDMTARYIELAKEKGEDYVLINFPAIRCKGCADCKGHTEMVPLRYDGTRGGVSGEHEGGLAYLRSQGLALWPEFFTMDVLLDFAHTFGAAKFNAMYQQIPDKNTGTIIQPSQIVYWCRSGAEVEGRIMLPRKYRYQAQSWDMRFKKAKSGSFVVGQVWGFWGEYKALLDQVRGQWGFEESCKAMIALSNKWPLAKKRWVEDKANGPAIEDRLNKRIKIKLVEPNGGDKAARMQATQSDWSNQTVLLPPPEEFDFVEPLVKRLLEFPKEPNDEGDATSQALNEHEKRSRFADSMED